MEERAKRFARLFRGSPRAHGYFDAQAATAGAKAGGKRWTAKKPATEDLFEQHLAGTYGLGAVPLLLDPPGHTYWFSIDVDDYTLDLAAFARMSSARGLPLIVCRSKSGGAHGKTFFTEPVRCDLVREKGSEWAALLGYPNAEIFPKQNKLSDNESDGDSYWGNWINLPYYYGDRGTRYALNKDGVALSVDEFLDLAETSSLTAAEFLNFTPVEIDIDDAFSEAPPCVGRMASGTVMAGARNAALFAAATFYRKSDPSHLQELVESFNRLYIVPPLPPDEVRTTVRSAMKKDYNYQCRESPLKGLCDRETCEDRAFGVLHGRNDTGGAGSGLPLGRLIKILTDPVLWRWEVKGEWVDLTTDEFTTQRLFLKRVLDKTNLRTRPMKPRAWEQLIDEVTLGAKIVVPPPDATSEGQLLYHLNRFCTGRAQARTLDEILISKPYTDPGTSRVHFVVADLISYLVQQRVQGVTERWIYAKLHTRGLEEHVKVLKGKEQTRYWSMPPMGRQTEEFDAPKPDDDIPF